MNSEDIKIKSVFLISSNFFRGNSITFDENVSINANIEINYNISEEDKSIGVIFIYSIKIPSDSEGEMDQISFSLTHFAELEIDNYFEIEKQDIDRFINVNVAAMIFPFIREQVATTTMKAGMAPIIIPSINFIKRYNEKNSAP